MTSSDHRFFGPETTIWALNREMILLLAGGRALLMQLAHPKVAAGVAEHSDFQNDPLGRLYRTMNRMWSIVFDDATQARTAIRQVEMIHRRVRGIVPGDEPAQAGRPYDALDQALLLWVHATLIDSAMLGYDLFVAPLSPLERRRYYDDSKKLAGLFGIQEKTIPPTLEAFSAYMNEMLTSGEIAAGAQAKRLARDILYPRPWLLRPAAPMFRLVTAGLLPEKLRNDYGLAWNRRREKSFLFVARVVRMLLPWIPPIIRIVPNARKVETAARRSLIRSAGLSR